jgi:L-lactate dehydrogenase complex protein LldE
LLRWGKERANPIQDAFNVVAFPQQPIATADEPVYQPGETVALFVPCYVDQFFPQAAVATANLLRTLGVSLAYPEEQTCCGQPAFNSGYFEQARVVVQHFCKVFERYRWIVTPSGSCAAMCRLYYQQVDSSQRIAAVASRVYELTEFLVDILGVDEIRAAYPRRVALHIGCQTRRALGIVEQPTSLLKTVRGLTLCEVPDPDACCGFGGTFSVKMEKVSLSMGEAKIESFLKSGAEVVASTDMSCLMHLSGLSRRSAEAKHIQFKYIAELLVAGHEESLSR